MPHPRPRRAPRPTEAEDDPAELARLRHQLWTRWRRNAWLRACLREMWRRVRLISPPNGPWTADYALAHRISHEFIAQGAVPPPGLQAAMYPDGWRK